MPSRSAGIDRRRIAAMAVADEALPEAPLVPADDQPDRQQAEEHPDPQVTEQRVDDAAGDLALRAEARADGEREQVDQPRDDERQDRKRPPPSPGTRRTATLRRSQQHQSHT